MSDYTPEDIVKYARGGDGAKAQEAIKGVLADKVMKAKLGDDYNKYIQEDSEGNTSYTEEGQDMFIEILDDFCNFIANFGMYSEEDRDDT